MKTNVAITIVVMMLLSAANTFAEVTINEVPLKQQDVSRLDGSELYSNLCSACHGETGKGDGQAATALVNGAPNLTLLSISNGGTFPHKKVEKVIRGRSRANTHGTINMPAWEKQFMALRSGWTGFPQKAFVRNRIHSLATHIETMQVDGPDENRVAKTD